MPTVQGDAVVGKEELRGAREAGRRLREAVGAEVDAAAEVVRLGGAHGVVHGRSVEKEATAGDGGAGEVVSVGVGIRGVDVLAPWNLLPLGDEGFIGRQGRPEFRQEDVTGGAFIIPDGAW